MLEGRVPLVYLVGPSGSGKTSWCLTIARKRLEEETRVIWISQKTAEPERFAQVMAGLEPHHAARFHAFFASDEFPKTLQMVINLVPQLPTTKLIIIEDWSFDTPAEKDSMQKNLSLLIETLQGTGIELVLTSVTYEDASGSSGSDGLKARSRKWFENSGFEVWFLTHIENTGKRCLSTPLGKSEWKLTNSGIDPV